MSDERWIVIPRWDEFQHRDMARSKVPPWIRNWTRLLNDDAYLSLTAHQRAVLHGLWMLYALTRRQVSANTASLSRQLNVRVSSRQLQALNQAGFIHLSASNPAGKPASTDREREFSISSKVEPYLGAPRKRPPRKPTSEDLPAGLLDKVMRLKGVDQGTPNVLAAFARRGLPEAAFHSALEATHELHDQLGEAEILYYVGVLRTMEREGQYQLSP